MGEDIDIRSLPEASLEDGAFLFGEVGGEVVKVPANEVGNGGGTGGGGSGEGGITEIPDNYVFTNSESDTEETPEVEEPILNADRLQGYKAEDFVKKIDFNGKIIFNSVITKAVQTFTVDNISQYSLLGLGFRIGENESFLNAFNLIPVQIFKTLTDATPLLFFNSPTAYAQIRFGYISDEEIKCWIVSDVGFDSTNADYVYKGFIYAL